jgi:hypothetical protein
MIVLRMLVEMWFIKAILMTFKLEMRNKLLETGGKAIHVIKWEELFSVSFVF